MRKQLIEVAPGCTLAADAQGEIEAVYPKGAPIDVLAERAARRTERHEARRWRFERHGLTPALEIHTA